MGTPLETLPPDPSASFAPVEPVGVNPDNPPWGLGGALGVWLLSFVLMVVVQLVFLVGLAMYRHIALAALTDWAISDAEAIFFQIVSIIPAHALTLGLAWLLVTRVGKYPFFPTLGWDWGGGLTFWRCVILAVALLATGTLIIKLTGNPETALDRLIESSRAAALTTAFAATFTAPLVEEVIYRGLLYSALRRLVGAGWAVSIVLVLFAAIHVPQYWPNVGVIVTIIVLSFVLTALRARTGRLLPCFVVHLVFNGIQSFFIAFGPYLDPLWPEKTPAPAPGVLLHVVTLLARAFH
ncbi:MAG: protease family protein [Acidobacteriota bacterium]|nr:protease family protein [Acidobacteriota bacterium]